MDKSHFHNKTFTTNLVQISTLTSVDQRLAEARGGDPLSTILLSSLMETRARIKA